jgi:hypothetical protein
MGKAFTGHAWCAWDFYYRFAILANYIDNLGHCTCGYGTPHYIYLHARVSG